MKLSSIIFEQNVKRITLSYSYPGDRLYSITINGEKQRGDNHTKAIEYIKKLTGKEVPIRGMYLDDEVQAVIDAMRKKGIDADAYEMDVT